MAAGPYPTKVMHEALKTRLDTLESAGPGAGGSSGPAYLSDQVALDTAGTRPIDLTEIPDELYVRSCALMLDPAAPPFTFSVLQGGLREGGMGLSLSVFASEADMSSGTMLFSGYTDDNYQIVAPDPITVPPGGSIQVAYEDYISHGSGRFLADPSLPPGFSYSVQATDVGGNPILSLTPALPFTLLTPGTVLGSLAPDAMNVRATPSTLTNGDFEIVDPGNAAPVLRYRASSGTIYRLEMTPEV